MAVAKVTSKGQVTLPKEIRDALGIRPGDRVVFVVQDDHTVRIYPQKKDVRELYGSIRPAVRGVTLDDMEAAISSGANE